MTKKNKLNIKLVRFYCINNEKIKLKEWQIRSIETNTYKYKLIVKYKGELKKPGNGLMATMAFKLSRYEGLLSIVLNERNIVFLYREINIIKLIKSVFGHNAKVWEYEEQNTNVEEQIKLIENKNNQVYFDKSIHEHLSKVYFNKIRKE